MHSIDRALPWKSACAVLVLACVALLPAPLATAHEETAAEDETAAENPFAGVEMRTQKVTDGIWMLSGAGGNIGVSAGEDGVFLIDDEWAPMTEKLLAALAEIQPGPVRFVLDTHWHGDHTGGNEDLGKAGAVIVAHENVRTRMSTDQLIEALDMAVPASPPAALPVITFEDAVTFHLNGDDVHAFHVAPAHTDGDSIVHFRKADVIHAGDVVFAGFYPFIDLSSGGSVDGVIAAVGRLLELAGPETKIIPGHGPLTDREGLLAYQQMLRGTRDAVAALVAEGKSREETIAAHPTAPWDETWGGGFTKPDFYVGSLWDSLSGE